MLFIPERHLPYIEHVWSESRVRDTIADILLRTHKDFDFTERLWPTHPNDRFEGCSPFFTDFYFGAAGVLWAVHELNEFGPFKPGLPSIDEILKLHLLAGKSNPDSAFCGELGIRFVKQVLVPSHENSSALTALMRSAAINRCREILYGGPGALAMAHILWRSGDENYRELCAEIAREILEQRENDEASGVGVWTQYFGETKKFVGAAHGTVGVFGVLIRVLRELGETNVARDLCLDAEKFLRAYAFVEGDSANWPARVDAGAASALMLVQWCHGAPGVLTDLSGCIPTGLSAGFDELFLKAASLVWKAGPLEKGASLCHGTAGSGLACLKMFERSDDTVWLERARGLAMFAIEQYQSDLAKFGQTRFSLWTGDLGLAIFLRDLLNKRGTLPGLI